ncbi:MAG: radical SAM protein [candidate division Zixibacteria bacterium]|nr:radical SAM protein [candidate division Zixibacteria bacterium]
MELNYLLADTHVHLEHDDFAADVDDVVSRAKDARVRYMVVPACAAADAARALELARRHDGIYLAAGLHANCGLHLDNAQAAGIEEALVRGKKEGLAVAVGECGLDYHYMALSHDEQLDLLRWHLVLARELELPIILHQREAEEDLRRVLDDEGVPPRGGVLHCFAGSRDYYEWARARGLYISFTGSITFAQKVRAPRAYFDRLDLKAAMLETDAPYMAPEPHRGKRNEPAYLPLVAEALSAKAGRPLEDVYAETTLAARRLFALPPDFGGAIAYRLRNSLYLNVTNRCTNDCGFCIRNSAPGVGGYDLRLKMEPTAAELVEAIGDPAAYDEIVFCGYGEPTIRWGTVKEVARAVKEAGGVVRLNTNGSAYLTQGRDVTPEMAGLFDKVSVSVNAPDEATYRRLCRPRLGRDAWHEVEKFVARAKRHVPTVVITAVAADAVSTAAMERLAKSWGVAFRLRRYASAPEKSRP